jgi:hypothetical protein
MIDDECSANRTRTYNLLSELTHQPD